jgi:hypothetical protein
MHRYRQTLLLVTPKRGKIREQFIVSAFSLTVWQTYLHILINVYWNEYGLIQTDATNGIVVYPFLAWLIIKAKSKRYHWILKIPVLKRLFIQNFCKRSRCLEENPVFLFLSPKKNEIKGMVNTNRRYKWHCCLPLFGVTNNRVCL